MAPKGARKRHEKLRILVKKSVLDSKNDIFFPDIREQCSLAATGSGIVLLKYPCSLEYVHSERTIQLPIRPNGFQPPFNHLASVKGRKKVSGLYIFEKIFFFALIN